MGSITDFGSVECLVVFLRPQLALAEMTSWPQNRLNAFGQTYSSIAGDWTGFYDWIRNSERSLLGVRYWPFEATEFVISRAMNLSYVKVAEQRYIEIFFSNERHIEAEFSKDQDFLYDPVYLSPSGECALAFSTKDLSDEDHNSISLAIADWVPI